MKRQLAPTLDAPFLNGVLTLSLDGKTTVIIIASTLLLTVNRYRDLTPWHSLDLALICLAAPLLLIVVWWGQHPSAYGLRIGNWRRGLLFTLGGIILIAPVLWLVTRTADFRVYYNRPGLSWGWLLLDNAVHLFSWEFFFRGFVLFGLARRFGDDAVFLQAVPFALAHFGKPELETLSTIFGGAAFGYVALKTDSMLYPFLIHCFVQVLVIALASGMI